MGLEWNGSLVCTHEQNNNEQAVFLSIHDGETAFICPTTCTAHCGKIGAGSQVDRREGGYILMMMNRIRVIPLALLLLAVLAISATSIQSVLATPAEKEADSTSLDGSWDMYWNVLLMPEQIDDSMQQPVPTHMPTAWQELRTDGEALPRFGHATYRKRIQVPPQDVGESKAIYIEAIGSAYRIWVDGREFPGMGMVGRHVDEEVPKLGSRIITFIPKQDTVEIVIQVSNYSFREGGIIGELAYGDVADMQDLLLDQAFVDLFFAGGFVLIGLYYLILYAARRKDESKLIIGGLMLLVAIRLLLLNEYVTYYVVPSADWQWMVKIEYLAEVGALYLASVLMKTLYPKEVHPLMLRVTYICAALLGVYVLLAPVRIFTSTMVVHAAVISAILLYFMFFVGMLAVMRKREGARINLFGLLIVVIGIANDALYHTKLLHTVEILEYCILLFVLLQAVIISYRYALLQHTLESKVAERTRELHRKNEELAQLQAARTKMLANIAHDLGSPIAGIQTYLQLMEQGMLRHTNSETWRPMLDKSESIKRLVGELFELSKLESGEMRFQYETVEVRSLIADVYQTYAPDLDRQQKELQIHRLATLWNGKQAQVRIDRFQLMRVFQNFIDNATKFSPSGTPIRLNAFIQRSAQSEPLTDAIRVEIVDCGSGIAKDDLPHVFQRFYKKQEGNASGSGIGLAIAKEIIEQHGGTVGVDSLLDEGSTFYFVLPLLSTETAALGIEPLRGDS